MDIDVLRLERRMREWRDLRTYFRAMADPRRIRMVAEIAATPGISVKEICLRLRASQPLVSWHLRVLVRCGLVTTRRQGRLVLCDVHRPAFAAYEVRLEQLLGAASDDEAVTHTEEPIRVRRPRGALKAKPAKL